jgi:hypothetical protein
MICLGLLVVVLISVSDQTATASRQRIVIPRECMTTAQYYKEDCNVEGTLLHCKDIWIDFICEQYSQHAIQK